MKKILFFLIIVQLISFNVFSQLISYDYITQSSESLKTELINNMNYFSGGNSELPYFQGKESELYIKFYKSTGAIVIFDFKSQTDYLELVSEIQNKANFRFKFCTDYNEQVVYNYVTNSNNKIRFNFNQFRISVEYPSKVNTLLENSSEFTTVFVCLSKNAYAYHTNLKCGGLGNCNTEIAKSSIKEAKNFNYRICEICTSDE